MQTVIKSREVEFEYSLFILQGIAYFWGLTIDPIVCMCVVVVIGLCVDYSVHIAHAFRDATGRT